MHIGTISSLPPYHLINGSTQGNKIAGSTTPTIMHILKKSTTTWEHSSFKCLPNKYDILALTATLKYWANAMFMKSITNIILITVMPFVPIDLDIQNESMIPYNDCAIWDNNGPIIRCHKVENGGLPPNLYCSSFE